MRPKNALHFVIELASEPKSVHPQITHKRPEWVVKCGWPVALESKVSEPRAAIRAGNSGRQIASAPGSQPHRNSENADRRAQYMEGLRFLFVMCRQVVGPEFFERLYLARLLLRSFCGRPCHSLPSCADRRLFVQCFSNQTCSTSPIGARRRRLRANSVRRTIGTSENIVPSYSPSIFLIRPTVRVKREYRSTANLRKCSVSFMCWAWSRW